MVFPMNAKSLNSVFPQIPQEETDEALSNVGVVQQISEDEPLTEDLEEESSGFSMVMM